MPEKPDDKKAESLPRIEDLFKDAPSNTPTSMSENPKKVVKNDVIRSSQGIEDLFKDPPSTTCTSMPDNPKKDVKTDILSLFEKVCFLFKNFIFSAISITKQQLKIV